MEGGSILPELVQQERQVDQGLGGGVVVGENLQRELGRRAGIASAGGQVGCEPAVLRGRGIAGTPLESNRRGSDVARLEDPRHLIKPGPERLILLGRQPRPSVGEKVVEHAEPPGRGSAHVNHESLVIRNGDLDRNACAGEVEGERRRAGHRLLPVSENAHDRGASAGQQIHQLPLLEQPSPRVQARHVLRRHDAYNDRAVDEHRDVTADLHGVVVLQHVDVLVKEDVKSPALDVPSELGHPVLDLRGLPAVGDEDLRRVAGGPEDLLTVADPAVQGRPGQAEPLMPGIAQRCRTAAFLVGHVLEVPVAASMQMRADVGEIGEAKDARPVHALILRRPSTPGHLARWPRSPFSRYRGGTLSSRRPRLPW